jgi:Domain of unknown function (DUF309)
VAPTPTPASRPGTILQSGRAKAYRPLPVEVRADAVREGLEAFRRGDAFLAHELLEPAWMGTAETAERELVQGLIKLAAAYVHAARDNALGVRKNLAGAREHLAVSVSADDAARPIAIDELASIDVRRLMSDIDAILARLARNGEVPLQRPTIRHRAMD